MQNVVADALSRKYTSLSSMQVKVVGFEILKDLYENDDDLSNIWIMCMEKPFKEFSIVEGFLFKDNVLYVPKCLLRISIVVEAHGGTLSGHFGRDKTLALVRSNFFWPRMEKDIARFVKQCKVCHLAKTQSKF